MTEQLPASLCFAREPIGNQMNHKPESRLSNEERICSQEAAYWYLQLVDDRPLEGTDFIQWLRRSPRNWSELLLITQIAEGNWPRLARKVQPSAPSPSDLRRLEDCDDKSTRGLIEQRSSQAIGTLQCPHWMHASIITSLNPTPEGLVISSNPVQLTRLVEEILRNPALVHQLHWRKWEEIVAAAYDRAGFEVILTPRSGDRGRDIIATRDDLGAIRIFDQVKALSPHRKVTSADVRAMVGVIETESNVSKAFVTTTSEFAPGIFEDNRLRRLMPYRLELRAHDALLQWLCNVQQMR